MLTRKWLVASFVLIALGAILFTLSACSSGGNLSDLLSPEYSINSPVLSFLHSPTLTPIHDHWKNHSLD